LLLCGDFNINGKSQREYQLIINSLGNNVRDLALEWASSQNQSAKSTFSSNSYMIYLIFNQSIDSFSIFDCSVL